MKVTITGSKLEIDLTALVQNMDEEARKAFYQELAFDEELLRACMDFLTSNYAFDCGASSTSYGPIISRLGDRLKERCLPLMDQASQELIKNLKDDLKYYSDEATKYRDYAWKLERMWPDSHNLNNVETIAVSMLPKCPRLP